MANKKIKVLLVDDSMFIRETFKKKLNEDEDIEVVDTAVDPYDARDKILNLHPDVLVLDVQMPRMNGIDFLKKLIPQYPIPVVVMSSTDYMVFDALKYGAVDFVNKPTTMENDSLDKMIRELMIKIKIASIANVSSARIATRQDPKISENLNFLRSKMIAIGASTGGTEALFEIINKLPVNIPGIVVVQHMPPVFTKMYAQRLNGVCQVTVEEARDGSEIIPGKVLIAPGGFQLKVMRKNGKSITRVFEGEKYNGHCPSVDILFNSVAEAYGKKAIGVILTGMGQDGAFGLLHMKQKGAKTIGQNEASSVVYGMPKVAFELGAVDYQLSINDISKKIISLI